MDRLPKDVALLVLRSLSARDFCACLLVCRAWRRGMQPIWPMIMNRYLGPTHAGLLKYRHENEFRTMRRAISNRPLEDAVAFRSQGWRFHKAVKVDSLRFALDALLFPLDLVVLCPLFDAPPDCPFKWKGRLFQTAEEMWGRTLRACGGQNGGSLVMPGNPALVRMFTACWRRSGDAGALRWVLIYVLRPRKGRRLFLIGEAPSEDDGVTDMPPCLQTLYAIHDGLVLCTPMELYSWAKDRKCTHSWYDYFSFVVLPSALVQARQKAKLKDHASNAPHRWLVGYDDPTLLVFAGFDGGVVGVWKKNHDVVLWDHEDGSDPNYSDSRHTTLHDYFWNAWARFLDDNDDDNDD